MDAKMQHNYMLIDSSKQSSPDRSAQEQRINCNVILITFPDSICIRKFSASEVFSTVLNISMVAGVAV